MRKIVKTNGKFLVYLGAQCPGFTTGKIYLTQFLGSSRADRNTRIQRKNVLRLHPADGSRRTYRVGQITAAMLEDSRSVITEADTGPLDKTSLGTVPEGALVVVLLPTGNGLRAEKFDGLGGYVEFIENNARIGNPARTRGLFAQRRGLQHLRRVCALPLRKSASGS